MDDRLAFKNMQARENTDKTQQVHQKAVAQLSWLYINQLTAK